MSDTPYERSSNYEVVHRATGRVLIAGYGIGMILTAILKKPDVSEVLVVERESDVLSLVDPAIRRYVGPRAAKKLVVLHADIFNCRRLLTWPFDCIYFDIWSNASTDALTEMTALIRKYRALKRSKESFMDCWDREWLRYYRRAQRRSEW